MVIVTSSSCDSLNGTPTVAHSRCYYYYCLETRHCAAPLLVAAVMLQETCEVDYSCWIQVFCFGYLLTLFILHSQIDLPVVCIRHLIVPFAILIQETGNVLRTVHLDIVTFL